MAPDTEQVAAILRDIIAAQERLAALMADAASALNTLRALEKRVEDLSLLVERVRSRTVAARGDVDGLLVRGGKLIDLYYELKMGLIGED